MADFSWFVYAIRGSASGEISSLWYNYFDKCHLEWMASAQGDKSCSRESLRSIVFVIFIFNRVRKVQGEEFLRDVNIN